MRINGIGISGEEYAIYLLNRIPYLDIINSIAQHDVSCGRDFENCKNCIKEENETGKSWSLMIRNYFMDNIVCRICGVGETAHNRDHDFSPLNVETPARQFRISLEDYKRIMNEEEQNLLDKTPEEIVTQIVELEQAIVELKIRKYRRSLRLMDIEKDLTAEQRRILQEKSKSYEIRDTGETPEIKAERKKRAAAKSNLEKAIEMTMDTMGWTRDKAEMFVKSNMAGAERDDAKEV